VARIPAHGVLDGARWGRICDLICLTRLTLVCTNIDFLFDEWLLFCTIYSAAKHQARATRTRAAARLPQRISMGRVECIFLACVFGRRIVDSAQ
jgi:hypothetical protein